jgi:DNA-binding HxlR family transcriptional regulator
MIDRARVTAEILGGKWVIPIVVVLASGTRRHGQLHQSLGRPISQKVLTETLRRMEGSGLVTRRVQDGLPPVVTYGLTDLGHSLLTPIGELADWALVHADRLPRQRNST